MSVVRIIAAAAFIATTAVGTAQAAQTQWPHSSPVPSNYIDDFGPLEPTTMPSGPTMVTNERSSRIPSNYVDDFGSLEPTTMPSGPTVVTNGRSSPVPSNYIDDFGTIPPEAPTGETLVAMHPE